MTLDSIAVFQANTFLNMATKLFHLGSENIVGADPGGRILHISWGRKSYRIQLNTRCHRCFGVVPKLGVIEACEARQERPVRVGTVCHQLASNCKTIEISGRKNSYLQPSVHFHTNFLLTSRTSLTVRKQHGNSRSAALGMVHLQRYLEDTCNNLMR